MPGAIRIPLRAADGAIRAYAIVDEADAGQAAHRWSWHGAGYAIRFVVSEGEQRGLLLHREILGLGAYDGRQTDHRNGDRLDCRRANLRIATHAENGQNVPPRGGSSRHRGVCWHAGRWRAYATLNGKQHSLGRFDCEDEAAAAARAFRSAHMPFANEERRA